jgi:hypothetical protein
MDLRGPVVSSRRGPGGGAGLARLSQGLDPVGPAAATMEDRRMYLELTPEEAAFLREHLAKHVAQVENELVHTDKRELQRALARDVDRLRGIERKLAALLPGG